VSSLILKRAIDIEAAAFKKFGNEANQSYRGKMRSLYQNIKNRSNAQLRKRLLSGELDAAQLVNLGFQDLKSDERRAEDERLMEENMNKAMVAKEEKSVSTALTCGKCHQKQVSYTQAQTRSADEPMTTFCDCQVCGHKWKVRYYLTSRLIPPPLLRSITPSPLLSLQPLSKASGAPNANNFSFI
jgi:transcription elongation factor S-II